MSFDFDERLDRRASGAEKWNEGVLERVFGRSDVLPLWVADMDFRSPPAAATYLRQRAAVGEFGYEIKPADLAATIRDWYRARHDWDFDPAHLVLSPSVMTGVAAAIQLWTEPGDGVVVQPPVFFEFDTYIRRNHREVIENTLRFRDGRYTFDLDDLESKTSDPKTKLLVLCNPHNPVGRAWTRDELRDLHAVCRKRGVHIVSDEIHGDLAYAPTRYTPLATIDEDAITCLSPAKTFNVGGVTGGVVHIRDEGLRERFIALQRTLGLMKTNALANGITRAVYRDGAEWLDAAMKYLAGNVEYARERIATIAGVELVEPDATFLLWLDLRGTGTDVRDLLVNRARLALNLGEMFGAGGEGFARLCIACPRSVLIEAFDRLESAV